MEKNLDQRAMIRFCVQFGYSATKTYESIRKVFSQSAVSHAKTFQRHGQFTSGKESAKDTEERKTDNKKILKHRTGGTDFEKRSSSQLQDDSRAYRDIKNNCSAHLQDYLKKERYARILHHTP